MNFTVYLELAFGLWFLQQVNDVVNAFLNRKFVPKMFWLSAACSFVSGLFLFIVVYGTLHDLGQVIQYILRSTGEIN